MKWLFLDAETYYDKATYTLRKMTPAEYILDPRFETVGWAVTSDGKHADWLEEQEFRAMLATLNPNNTAIVTHNALFDMCILAWRYNFVPRLSVDTLSMSRALLSPQLRSLSLENVAIHLKLGVKGKTVHDVSGMNLAALKQHPVLYSNYQEYSKNDACLCYGIFQALKKQMPPAEFIINDIVIRMATKPKFQLDTTLLAEHLHTLQTRKKALLARVGMEDTKTLRSDALFAQALTELGVDVPMKTSPTTGQRVPAFAKTDAGMRELEEHPDLDVQALAAARLGVKTTIEESRTERFITLSQLTYPSNPGSWMPVPLKYSGAHTHRLSGDWKINAQNLPRGGALRRALRAPEGKVVVTADASQIEARLTAWVAGEMQLLKQFENGEDVYSTFASTVYGYPVNKNDHKVERFLGKTSILGLGFGMGAPKFELTVKTQAAVQKVQIAMDAMLAARVVSIYRSTLKNIPASWRYLDQLIPALARGGTSESYGGCEFGPGWVKLPNDMKLHYHNLRREVFDGRESWVYDYSGGKKFLWGGTLLENIVQALDRVIVFDAALRVRQRLEAHGVELAHQVHDELVYVVDEAMAAPLRKLLTRELKRRPAWAQDLPLASETGQGQTYGDAK